jgi:hypothetical protein
MTASTPVIETHGLSKSFGHTEALAPLDLVIPRGAFSRSSATTVRARRRLSSYSSTSCVPRTAPHPYSENQLRRSPANPLCTSAMSLKIRNFPTG